jgi:predicted N-acetyltransferase YhbS
MIKPYTELLTSAHVRGLFKSGYQPLDAYLKKQASQDSKRKLAVCFVKANEQSEVIGYYTLSNSSIPRHWLSEDYAKKFGRYDSLPVTLLGRLAVDTRAQGKGVGFRLVMDAAFRAYSLTTLIGSVALAVDPIDDLAFNYYLRFGFIPLNTGKMFLPMQTIATLLSKY